jgi:hypothetical protein
VDCMSGFAPDRLPGNVELLVTCGRRCEHVENLPV